MTYSNDELRALFPELTENPPSAEPVEPPACRCERFRCDCRTFDYAVVIAVICGLGFLVALTMGTQWVAERNHWAPPRVPRAPRR